jgi:hypothetical protein
LLCGGGGWSNGPSSFGYQWERNGHPIAGATASAYLVQIGDEAGTLSCVVTARNGLGAGPTAASAGILVAIPGTLHCPQPAGSLRRGTLGPLKLGMKRTAARRRLPRFGVTHNDFDSFCLYAGWGIRVGYPPAGLLRSLPASERGAVTGRIVLALTANPYYALDGVRPGAKLTKHLVRRLKLGDMFRIGLNDWYIGRGSSSDGVLKVRHDVVQEVGIANRRLTATRGAQRRFLTSFKNAQP